MKLKMNLFFRLLFNLKSTCTSGVFFSPGKHLFHRLLITLMLLSPGIFFGCGTVNKVKDTTVKGFESLKKLPLIPTASSPYKKSVVFAPMKNVSVLPNEFVQEIFERPLKNICKESCSSATVVSPGDKRYPERLANIPLLESGEFDNIFLADIGPSRGHNAVVISQVLSVSTRQEKSGILWFRKNRNFALLHMRIKIYDTVNGTKLLDDQFIHETKIDGNDYAALKTQRFNGLDDIREEWIDLAESMGDRVCQALENQPWSARLIDVTDDRVILSFGNHADLKTGDEFSVHERLPPMEGVGGHEFFLFGKKIGEIRITSVSAFSAEGRIVSGEGITPGCKVTPGR